MNLLVIDSSVFNKLYLDEPDSDLAVALFDKARLGDYQLIAPDLLYLEVISTANYYRLPIQSIVELLAFQTRYLLQLCTPTTAELKKAVNITQVGSPNSGYPSIYDACFHAMALHNNALFVTADKRHYEKTKHLGNIELLRNLVTHEMPVPGGRSMVPVNKPARFGCGFR